MRRNQLADRTPEDVERILADRVERQKIRVDYHNKKRAHWRAAMRRTTCLMCNEPMIALRASKHYCSAKCRQAGHRRYSDATGTSLERKKRSTKKDSTT